MSGDAENDKPEACAKAVGRGCYIILPTKYELFVDIDSEVQEAIFKKGIQVLDTIIESVNVRPSPSKRDGHYHAIVKLSMEVTAEQRLMFQAMLGSDPVREALTWCRHHNGETDASMFFENENEQMVKAFATVVELCGHEKAIDLSRDWRPLPEAKEPVGLKKKLPIPEHDDHVDAWPSFDDFCEVVKEGPSFDDY